MGKHTRFDSSDEDEKPREEKVHKHHRKEEKKHKHHEEKKDRDRSPRHDKHRDEKDRRGSTHEQRRDRDDYKRRDRDRGDRRNDYDRRDRDRNREQDKSRLSQEEIKAQRKALWGNKPKTDEASTSESSSSAPVAKNEKLWSSAIAATGVDQSQASKFMRLMGVKNAPKPTEQDAKLGEKQTKLLSDLERQYAIARETTHMGKGNGLGFH